MEMIDYVRLIDIINDEFADIVISTAIIDAKLRVVFIDNSYIDFWWSKNLPGRYAHHWERRHIDGTIYRHDNAPHTKWQHIPTYPKHFHNKKDSDVTESNLSENVENAVRDFLHFAKTRLQVKQTKD